MSTDRIVKPHYSLRNPFHEAFRVRVIPYKNFFGRERWRVKLESKFMSEWRGVPSGNFNLGYIDCSSDVQRTAKSLEQANAIGNQWLDQIEDLRLPGEVLSQPEPIRGEG